MPHMEAKIEAMFIRSLFIEHFMLTLTMNGETEDRKKASDEGEKQLAQSKRLHEIGRLNREKHEYV